MSNQGRKAYALVPESELAQTMAKSQRDARFWLHQKQWIGRAVNRKDGIPIPNDWTQFSSMHCRVFAEMQADQSWAWFVEDNSTNGTWVNDQKCDKGVRVQLQAGDTLRLSVTGAGAPTLEFKFVQEMEQVDEADGRGDNYSSGAQKRRLSAAVDAPDITPTKRPNAPPAPASARAPHIAHDDAASPAHPVAADVPKPSPGSAAAAAVAGLHLHKQQPSGPAAPSGQTSMNLEDAAGMYKANNLLRKKVDRLAAERDAAAAAAEGAAKRLTEEQATVAELRHKLAEQEGGLKAQVAELTAKLAAEQEARALDAQALTAAKAGEEGARSEGQRLQSELWLLRAEVSSKQGLLDSLSAQVTELGTRARDAEAAAARAHDEVRGLREELGREQASLSALRARESELVRERDARGAEVDGVREELERVRVQLAAEAGGAREVQAALERVQMEAEGRGERLALKALAEQHALDAAVALQAELAAEVQRLVSAKLGDLIAGPMQRLRAIDALELMATQMGTYPAPSFCAAPAPSGAAPAPTQPPAGANALAAAAPHAAAGEHAPPLPPLPPAATQALGLGLNFGAGLYGGLRGGAQHSPQRSSRSAAPAPTTTNQTTTLAAGGGRSLLDLETQAVDTLGQVAARGGAPPLLPPGWHTGAAGTGLDGTVAGPQGQEGGQGEEVDSPLQGGKGEGARMEEDGAEARAGEGEGDARPGQGAGLVPEGDDAGAVDGAGQVEGDEAAGGLQGGDEGMTDAHGPPAGTDEQLTRAGVCVPATAAAPGIVTAQTHAEHTACMDPIALAAIPPAFGGVIPSSSDPYLALPPAALTVPASPTAGQQPRLTLAAALGTPVPSSRTTSHEPPADATAANEHESGHGAAGAAEHKMQHAPVAAAEAGAGEGEEGDQQQQQAHEAQDAQMQDVVMATEPQDREMGEGEMGGEEEEEEGVSGLGGDEESLPQHSHAPHAPNPGTIFGADASESQGQAALFRMQAGMDGVVAGAGVQLFGMPAEGAHGLSHVLSDRSNSYGRPVSQEQGTFPHAQHMSVGKAGGMPPSLQHMM